MEPIFIAADVLGIVDGTEKMPDVSKADELKNWKKENATATSAILKTLSKRLKD